MAFDNMEDVRRAGYGYADDPQYTGRGGRDSEGVANYTESPASISTKNYDVPNLDDDQSYFNAAAAGVQMRPGVRADPTQANAALAQALNSAWRQPSAFDQMQRAASGDAPSASAIGNQMALDDAIARQYAGGGSGANQYLAGLQGAGTMGAINAQYGAQRANEIGQAQQTLAGYGAGVRGNYLQQMGQSQNFAYQQAQLDAAQMARNDEMSRFYTGQGNQLGMDQLMANQAYEAQKGELALQIKQQQQAQKQAAEDRYQRRIMGGANAATGGVLGLVT